jgi:hypothetical protein
MRQRDGGEIGSTSTDYNTDFFRVGLRDTCISEWMHDTTRKHGLRLAEALRNAPARSPQEEEEEKED